MPQSRSRTMDTNFSTPVEALLNRAKVEPDRLAFIFLEQGEVEAERLTFTELDRGAREIAAYLQTISEPGERALLIYPTSLDFVKAIYGCLYAGIIPVPTNPPGLNRSARRLDTIAKDAQARLALSTPEFLKAFEHRDEHFPELHGLQWVNHASFKAHPDLAWQKPDLSPQKIAFIQYTSGSTSIPKGVMVSYRNLWHNHEHERDFRKHEMGEDSVNVTWAPIFHDMGLILGIFEGVFDGNLSVLLTPVAFIQKPVRWLNAISKYHGTFSGGPNFAYEVCVNKTSPEERQGLDLSSWRLAYNGAEPVRPETQANFSQMFASCGFKPEVFGPCYGLAEATIIVSGYAGAKKTLTLPVRRDSLEQGKIVPCDPNDCRNCQDLVDCGPPLAGIQAAIVNPVTCMRCPPGEVGEIWISGGNNAEGYWNRPKETEATFRAVIKDTGEGPFLRTGDLGFIQEGDLYVTGRIKDMIIIRGRNYYPQDIELTVEKCHPAIQPGGGAAFSIHLNGTEHLAIVFEVREKYRGGQTWEEIIQKVRAEVAREHGIRAYAVSLISRATISKTSSGKIMRSECRNAFLNNQLETIAEWRALPI
jgi:acyl-CoA synthetase (AMP-forming)/AMP-acid ligase II